MKIGFVQGIVLPQELCSPQGFARSFLQDFHQVLLVKWLLLEDISKEESMLYLIGEFFSELFSGHYGFVLSFQFFILALGVVEHQVNASQSG